MFNLIISEVANVSSYFFTYIHTHTHTHSISFTKAQFSDMCSICFCASSNSFNIYDNRHQTWYIQMTSTQINLYCHFHSHSHSYSYYEINNIVLFSQVTVNLNGFNPFHWKARKAFKLVEMNIFCLPMYYVLYT